MNLKRVYSLSGQMMRADNVKNIKNGSGGVWDISFEITLHTGFNRQIRRMCGKIHLSVVSLVRTRVCKLKLSNMKITSGEFKTVSRGDIIDE